MSAVSPFSQDWRDCLKAHYTHVVRTEDHRTEKTLRAVLYECGYDDDALKEWYLLATMHVDDAPPDFVPDEEHLKAFAAVVAPDVPPIEASAPPDGGVNDLTDELMGAVIEAASEDAPDEDADPPPDPNGFQQLSLF